MQLVMPYHDAGVDADAGADADVDANAEADANDGDCVNGGGDGSVDDDEGDICSKLVRQFSKLLNWLARRKSRSSNFETLEHGKLTFQWERSAQHSQYLRIRNELIKQACQNDPLLGSCRWSFKPFTRK